ncbi:MAG TPA: sel1 repeat family protein [Caulobacteraceae bacterium]|nr:sel1 repeat family protein [Caulobacteraceae bacterium]
MSQAVLESRLPPPSSQPSGEELFRLGLSYATGLGAPVDLVSAHALFDLAARFGSLEAKIYRREIGDEMDPGDVAEAQRIAREWLSRL